MPQCPKAGFRRIRRSPTAGLLFVRVHHRALAVLVQQSRPRPNLQHPASPAYLLKRCKQKAALLAVLTGGGLVATAPGSVVLSAVGADVQFAAAFVVALRHLGH